MDNKKNSAQTIRSCKGDRKIVAITAYDYSFARLADEWVDVLLIGDSLGMVIQGEPTTLSVKLEDVLYHSRAVSRGARNAHVVADMPFMSFQVSIEEAIRNAGCLLSEGRAEAVKLEGGVLMARTIEALVDRGIPVMGHIGLTPQSVHAFGGYKIQGKTDAAKESILQDALAVEDAGAYAIVIEGVPTDLAKKITEAVKIPTIGIAAGPYCDGQILVSHDILGLTPNFSPKFVKQYGQVGDQIRSALKQYSEEVQQGVFPDAEHSF